MLDVHPPHHAASTWRDFFIHIATIVIGLLIAVGLEQIVEFFHHRHQAHQMQESLREESLENQEIAQTDIETLDGWVRDYRAQMDLLQAAPVKEGKVAVTLTPPQTRNGWFPLSDTAWLNVRDGGGLECPATFVPVEMRQTGMRGTGYGTREEAYGGADRESAATG
jgi:hypothetical protein